MDEKIKEILKQYAANKDNKVGLDDWAAEEIKKLFRPQPIRRREETQTRELFEERS